MKFFIYVVLALSVVFTSCKTNEVYIKVTHPAPVTISKDVKFVGVVNRSIPSDDNKALNTIHQNKNVQSVQLIKDASAECIAGLNNALTESKRFDINKPITNVDLRTSVAGSFPAQLPWEEVDKICSNHGVDGLFVLEIFDTEFKVMPVGPPLPNLNNTAGVINTINSAQVDIVTTVKTGWRFYDAKNKLIADEFPMANNMTIRATAYNLDNTMESMMGRKEAIKQNANRLGAAYVDRILPYRTTVTREYFVKGSENLKIATRKARTGNWDGAGELWLKDTQSSSRKIAGRACYNMAILGEINGDLDGAISWAQKSYENYNNGLALKYVNQLKNRKANENRLQNQVGN